MSETFLSQDELKELTGRSRRKKQIEWLQSNGFTRGLNFWVNASGDPIVSKSAIETPYKKAEAPKKEWKSNAWNNL